MKRAVYHTATILLFAFSFSVDALEIKGARSCGSWVEERSKHSMRAVAAEGWLMGFLSGLVSHSGKDALKGTDNESIFLWTDSFCRANPLKHIDDAGVILFFELVRQKGL